MTHWEGGCLHQLAVGKICGSFAPGSALKSHGSGNKRMTNHECGSKHQESNKVKSKAGCLVLDFFVCLNSWSGCICTFWRWILFCFFSGLAFRSWSKSFLQDGLFSGCIIGDRMCCAVSPPKIARPICGKLIKVWPNSSLSASTSSPSLLLSSLNHSPVACGLILRETFYNRTSDITRVIDFACWHIWQRSRLHGVLYGGYRMSLSLSLLSLSSLSLSFL